MASPPSTGGHLLSHVNNSNNIKKCGYLKKQKHGHRRFFVLREPGDGFSARLEYYESEKKWKNKSAPKRLIPLDSCLCINKRADAKYKYLIALYTKDEYFAVAAESEQEQEEWFADFAELIAEGKVYASPAATSSLVGFEDASYGVNTPAAAVYKEVWQVNLKSKGLGQSRNMTGVYRLCLSSRTISFVKLNAETASVSLQLMNIRRCGHSDNFFFMEVGRSAVTGPGELWMQADDCVVAQNIHETILEAMKAMKELAEYRPRSKSQSASTTPISVPTRRHLNHLPPSQTGFVRRSRTDSLAASPGRKFNSCRIRTSSEGDGYMGRPLTMSISMSGSPTGYGQSPLSRSHTLSSGRTCRMLESHSSILQHSCSMSTSNSPPASSPLSLSPRTAELSCHHSLSCSASISGSLGDGGFPLLCDEFSSSPGDTAARYLLVARSNTPDSLASTPPSHSGGDDGCGYMLMQGQRGSRAVEGGDGSLRKRTYSLTTPRQQRVPLPQPSSASLDENTLWSRGSVWYPDDYGQVRIGPTPSTQIPDKAYVPMAPPAKTPHGEDSYMPMSPMCVSAPQQILKPRSGSRPPHSPAGSFEDSGYMRMFSSNKSSTESLPAADGYMNMSPRFAPQVQAPPLSLQAPTSLQAPPLSQPEDHDQYVLMTPQSQRLVEAEADYYAVLGAAKQGGGRGGNRIGRPNRLALDTLHTLPSMHEHPLPPAHPGDGEYINVDFSHSVGYASSAKDALPDLRLSPNPAHNGTNDYMERMLGMDGIPPRLPQTTDSPKGREQQEGVPTVDMFLLEASSHPMDPNLVRSAKVIRADPQGRRRHSSETFSPTTVSPVCPLSAHQPVYSSTAHQTQRHSSVEDLSPVSTTSSTEPSDDETSGSPLGRDPSVGQDAPGDYQKGLQFIRDMEPHGCDGQLGFPPSNSCKGGLSRLHCPPYACLGFKEQATTAKD